MKSLVVWALSDNDPAVDFYRALGGRAVARSSERFGTRCSRRSPTPGTGKRWPGTLKSGLTLITFGAGRPADRPGIRPLQAARTY